MESVEFRQYLQNLCDDLANMASINNCLVVEGTEVHIPTITAIPLAFIACELITNSIKYAKGRIVVSLQGTPIGCALLVSDEGPGLPQGFNPATSKGLGMKLVTALVKQIGGVLDIAKGDRDQGTRFTVRFERFLRESA